MIIEVELAIPYQSVIRTAQYLMSSISLSAREKHQIPSFFCSLFSTCHCAPDTEMGLRIETHYI